MPFHRSRRHLVRPRIDSLEDRAVPTVTTAFDFGTGRLTVRSDGRDPIVVTAAGFPGARVVAVNGRWLFTVPAPTVRTLDVEGGPGDNRISLAAVTHQAFTTLNRVEADGGPGKDTLIGSAFADDLAGGPGADMLWGLAGGDTLRGGGGADLLRGGAGDDRLESADPIEAGFNDGTGLAADPTTDSPYAIGGPAAGQGAAEPGWAGPWVQTTGEPGLAVVQGIRVFEGDGALRISGGTAELHRSVGLGAATGILSVSQWVYIPPDGNVTAYVHDGFMERTAGTAAKWTASAGGHFEVVDGGEVRDTGFLTPVDQWFRVEVRVDMDTRTWEFFVDGRRVPTSDPLAFRGTPGAVDTVNYLVESVAGVALDAVQVSGADAALALAQGDTLRGGYGADTFRGAGGPDLLFGGPGGDSLSGGPAADRLFGGADEDQLGGDAGDDVLWGLGGRDQARGGEGSDQVFGGLGADFLYGGRGADTMDGGPGADMLFGDAGPDSLAGGTGNDTVSGDTGDDRLAGQDGNDQLGGGGGADGLDGGPGNDDLSSGDSGPPLGVEVGFNGAEGLNADSTPDSPYPLGLPVAGGGNGEPGWAGGWEQTTGAAGLAVVQTETAFEGDGALRLSGGTAEIHRTWADSVATGLASVQLQAFLPAGGHVIQYVRDGSMEKTAGTAAQWAATAGGTFAVIDGGGPEDTDIPVPVQHWFQVEVRVDTDARTWELWINGIQFNPPDPLDFRGNPAAVDTLTYLVESVPGAVLDAIQVVGPDAGTPPETMGDTLIGGLGRDGLAGGRGNDLLVGGVGMDSVNGGDGRNLLVGGTGDDNLTGAAGQDIVIGGVTVYDSNPAALPAILAEWSSSRDVPTRVANISGTGSGLRLNGTYFLTASTVRSDAAADSLAGEADIDWFFVRPAEDTITDLAGDDQVTNL